MAEPMYFVAAAPDSGLVGVLAESEVGRRPAAGGSELPRKYPGLWERYFARYD